MSWQSKAIGKLKKNGGRLVTRCGQGEEPMFSVLQLHKKSSQGICRTLVMKWMCERAHGRDFWDWLTPGGKLNVGAVANVTIQHINVGKVDVDPTTMRGMLEQREGSWREDLSGSTAMGIFYRQANLGVSRRDAPLSHSFNFDHRLRPETFRTAMATAFF